MTDFKKNNAGRPKNSRNKNTTQIREQLKLLLDNNIEQLQTDIDTLTASNRVNALLQLCKLILPKQIETEDTTPAPNTFIQDVMDIDEEHFKQALDNDKNAN